MPILVPESDENRPHLACALHRLIGKPAASWTADDLASVVCERGIRACSQSTSPGTIEFRLQDGSAHPNLLLAGVAQAVVAGRELRDLDHRLARTAVTAERASDIDHRVPLTFLEVADALVQSRAVFEAGGVFTPNLLDRVIAVLCM